MFYLSEGHSPPMTPYFPPYTLYGYTYMYSHRAVIGGGELTREKVRGAIVHKGGSKNTNMTDVTWLFFF